MPRLSRATRQTESQKLMKSTHFHRRAREKTLHSPSVCVPGLSIVIGWPAFGDVRNRSDEKGRQRRITTKETNGKKTLKIAEEFESAVRTKRTLEQVQKVWTGSKASGVFITIVERTLRAGTPIHPKAFDLVERQHKTGIVAIRMLPLRR